MNAAPLTGTRHAATTVATVVTVATVAAAAAKPSLAGLPEPVATAGAAATPEQPQRVEVATATRPVAASHAAVSDSDGPRVWWVYDPDDDAACTRWLLEIHDLEAGRGATGRRRDHVVARRAEPSLRVVIADNRTVCYPFYRQSDTPSGDLMGNTYLTGNFAPVQQELTATDLAVTGSIPDHLDGRYVRNGPNPIGEVDEDAYHWFMGEGMVHGVRLRDGRAEWYRNRWVRSAAVAAALGEPARPPARSAAIRGFTANTNVTTHAGRTLALVEAGPAPYELTEELDTVGPCDFDGTVRGGYAAHPKHDPVTGEMHAVNYHFGRGNTVQYSVVGLDGRARRTVDVQVHGSPMMHDFALTEHYVVFLDLPVVFDPAKGAVAAGVPAPLRRPAELVLSGLIGKVRVPDPITARSLGSRGGAGGDMPYSWDDRYPARIGVMPREGDGSDVRWFDVDPMYVFHTLGAYEDGPDGSVIVLDAARHDRMFTADPHGPDGEHPTLHRWRLDLRTGRVSETVLDDREQEFPRADERLVGRRHRFAYTVSTGDRFGEPIGDSVLRHDLDAGTTERRRLGAHAQAGEFVFVPSGADAAEDDGVLMGFVYDADADRSRLALLDAASLDTVAEVLLPARVPHGFHGNWLPA